MAIAAAAFGIAVGAREAGFFERSDLAIHDALVRSEYPEAQDDRFVIVLESEADLQRWKFPLADEVFAELLTRILAGDPAVIAIDKIRDVPVEPGAQRLAAILRASDRIYWVRKFANRPGEDVAIPSALDPRFAGCDDVVDDRDGMVRRGLLYLDDGGEPCYSLGFQVARRIASQKKLAFTFPKDDPGRFDLGTARVRTLESCDGPYAYVDTGGFQVAFHSARASRARVVGLTDVLEGRIDPATFRGKAVFFGSAADSLHDYFNVPTPGAEGFRKVTGVALHAALASYLLEIAEGRAPAMKLAPRSFGFALAALIALAAACIACMRRSVLVTVVGMGLVAALLAFTAHAMAHNGVFTGFTAPVAALALAFVGGVIRSGWLERRERAQLMSIFGRHVSREVAEDLWRRRDEIFTHGTVRPRQIVATILFLDVRSFTTVTEKLGPQHLVGWLNRGLTVMIDEIMQHRGVVTRFAGDAIMAVFGSPVPRESDSERATDAMNAIDGALAIGPALDRLNAAFEAEGLPKIRVRIGINTGSVTQCSVGAANRAEFTVLGDATNTASRLESYTMDDGGETARILIGEETYRFAGERYVTRSVGSIPLKGKEIPVTVHQVLSKR